MPLVDGKARLTGSGVDASPCDVHEDCERVVSCRNMHDIHFGHNDSLKVLSLRMAFAFRRHCGYKRYLALDGLLYVSTK